MWITYSGVVGLKVRRYGDYTFEFDNHYSQDVAEPDKVKTLLTEPPNALGESFVVADIEPMTAYLSKDQIAHVAVEAGIVNIEQWTQLSADMSKQVAELLGVPLKQVKQLAGDIKTALSRSVEIVGIEEETALAGK